MSRCRDYVDGVPSETVERLLRKMKERIKRMENTVVLG